jgi:hypothetical protein
VNVWQWVCESAAGYLFCCFVISMVTDEVQARRRPHLLGRSSAGGNWRAVWPPAYAAWVRRFHDHADAREKLMMSSAAVRAAADLRDRTNRLARKTGTEKESSDE